MKKRLEHLFRYFSFPRLSYFDDVTNWHTLNRESAVKNIDFRFDLKVDNNITRSDLMVSALDSGSSDPESSPGREHCVEFLGKTLYSHSASLHPGIQMGVGEFNIAR